ncbi:MAG: zinc ribbon domain-containing protein [Nanoarchaeota archaeon]|nr:zinc ribbon domain-containing protein [Nanoarchaeota archaeon]MBU1854212.1 zinc ribbon domain-containing protein [Nanoarchaeota archaeon]
MAFCSKCGFQADIDDSFCARCGAELKHVENNEEAEFVDWRKKTTTEKESFWSILKQSFRHTFFDNDEKLPRKRIILNTIILIAILGVAVWILAPYLDTITFSIGTNNNQGCRYRLDAQDIVISGAKFFQDNMTMELLITNSKPDDIVIETLAKTYEFKFDNSGDTDVDDVSMVVPSGRTLKLHFDVRKEPYILGLEFSGCEKLKVSDWEDIFNS